MQKRTAEVDGCRGGRTRQMDAGADGRGGGQLRRRTDAEADRRGGGRRPKGRQADRPTGRQADRRTEADGRG
eukprot:14345128-Alexandrium_andersonii.AAC.1